MCQCLTIQAKTYHAVRVGKEHAGTVKPSYMNM